MSRTELAQAERRALCDLLLEVGPDHPTLCGDWTTSHLAAHLYIRERKPLTGPGIMLGGPFAAYTERVLEKVRTGTARRNTNRSEFGHQAPLAFSTAIR